jgi:methionine-rich copper-binding protein CopC
MNVRAGLRAAASLALLASFSTDLSAHVSLYRAVPAVSSVVHASPVEVRLWFTHTIEAAFSTVKVLDSNGRQVDKRDKQVEPSDPTLLRVSLAPLVPGTYRVYWRAVSVDTHVTRGQFTFTVRP